MLITESRDCREIKYLHLTSKLYNFFNFVFYGDHSNKTFNEFKILKQLFGLLGSHSVILFFHLNNSILFENILANSFLVV